MTEWVIDMGRVRLIGMMERMLLGAAMSVAVFLLERRLRKSAKRREKKPKPS